MIVMDNVLRDVFQGLFGIEEIQFGDALSMDDIDTWDSVTHISLVLAIEQAFQVSIPIEEIPTLTIVSSIKECLKKIKAE